jgi:hypothetical protein
LQKELTRLQQERAKQDRALFARAEVEWKKRKPTRPRIDPKETEEAFAPVSARYVRIVIHAGTGGRKSPGYLSRFEVWSAGESGRNMALASLGASAAGERSTVAEDFPDAYGPQYVIDGRGENQWFIGQPAILTITLPEATTIDRVRFGNMRAAGKTNEPRQETPCEYEILVSTDNSHWQCVASTNDRIPWTETHGIERVQRELQTAAEKTAREELGRKISALEKQLANLPKPLSAFAGVFKQFNEPTFVHKGGDPMQPAAAVLPGSPRVLDGLLPAYDLSAQAKEGERRLKLAQWITADENALTLRVLANRVWQHHFGTGIVDTPSDFGFLGSQPSHPQLLDFLAARLKQDGWRLKPLHRLILNSQAYRQSSAYRDDAARVDKDARFLWRFPPRRLNAEEIRDGMLSVAGKLDTRMGGPGFRLYRVVQNNVSTYFPLDLHGPDTYRRAIYHQNVRASVIDLLSDFDLPDNAFAAPRRAATVSPLQALTQLNHAFTLDMATALVARARARAMSPSDDAGIVREIYRLGLQRHPTLQEQTEALDFVRRTSWQSFARAFWNFNEFYYVD